MPPSSSEKLSLPAFLKFLTSNNVAASKAMAAAGKIYKTHNTPSALAQLTDVTLKSLGIQDKDDRRSILTAIKKAYPTGTDPHESRSNDVPPRLGDIRSVGSAVPSSPSVSITNAKKPKINQPSPTAGRKRKRREDPMDRPLPDRPPDEGDTYGSSDFNEVLDPEVLRTKSTVVNRAPIMTAWAMVVAERTGFQREEALSIATVYTDMNAISKGVSLGIYDPGKGKIAEASPSGAQPYVDLMGRRVPLYRANITAETTQWRALSASAPVSPSSAYTYITSSLRQTTPFIIGALRLLAQSYEPGELNKKGFALYADFRPDIESGQKGWGKRGEVKCQTILDMIKKGADSNPATGNLEDIVKTSVNDDGQAGIKKPRNFTLADYETLLDDDFGFDAVDLETLP